MSDMSKIPHVPTIKHALDIIHKISLLDADAPAKIAMTMLRIANKNRIDDNRRTNDPHMERMAFFLAGADTSRIETLFASPAFLGHDMRQSDVDELVSAIERYLSGHPVIAAKTGFTEKQSRMLESCKTYSTCYY